MRQQSRHINPDAEAGGRSTDYQLIARAQARDADGKPTADAVAARNMLIIRHEHFIWNTVRKTLRGRAGGPGGSAGAGGAAEAVMLKQRVDDHFGDGVYAFIRAVDGFDLSTGNSLTTYAFKSIWSHIIRARSIDTPVTRPAFHSRSKMDAMAGADKYELARSARRLHRASDGGNIDPAYLTRHARQESGVESLLGGMDDAADHAVMMHAFRESLTEREVDVLVRRFMQDQSLKEIGEVYGVGRERIRQIETEAVGKAQAWLMERGHLVGSGQSGEPKTQKARRVRR